MPQNARLAGEVRVRVDVIIEMILRDVRDDRDVDLVSGDADLVRAGLDPAAAVDLALEPGDVALWHLHLVHGSGPNRSAADRRFYLNGYVAADDCDRGVLAFRDGEAQPLGAPVLIHYEELHERPGPHYVDA